MRFRIALVGFDAMARNVCPLAQGILEYERAESDFCFTCCFTEGRKALSYLEHSDCHGALVRLTDPQMVVKAKRVQIPLVNVSSRLEVRDIPTVCSDDEAVGVFAAKHLSSVGLRRFAFIGVKSASYSARRFAGFIQASGIRESDCYFLEVKDTLASPVEMDAIKDWLSGMEYPTGIFACTDTLAHDITSAARMLSLRVPDDLSVIGADGGVEFCESHSPALSGVDRDEREIGYQAMRLLLEMLRTRKAGNQKILIPPKGVTRRASTETYGADDPCLRRVIRFIQDHYAEGINVSDLVNLVPFSRILLERRFKKELNLTPYDFIQKVRVDAAIKRLRDDPDLSLAGLAKCCGFRDRDRLNLVFRRVTGLSPQHFRNPTEDR